MCPGTQLEVRERVVETRQSLIPWRYGVEQIRWSMDRIGFRYLEVDYPWGLHLFGSLPFSDKELSVVTPILIREPSEVRLVINVIAKNLINVR